MPHPLTLSLRERVGPFFVGPFFVGGWGARFAPPAIDPQMKRLMHPYLKPKFTIHTNGSTHLYGVPASVLWDQPSLQASGRGRCPLGKSELAHPGVARSAARPPALEEGPQREPRFKGESAARERLGVLSSFFRRTPMQVGKANGRPPYGRPPPPSPQEGGGGGRPLKGFLEPASPSGAPPT